MTTLSSTSSLPAAEVRNLISDQPLPVMEMYAAGQDPGAGAVVLFSGAVRDHSGGKGVSHLEYSAYKAMAAKMIAQILEDARNKFPLYHASCRHRVGELSIGEPAVVVVTASAHREEAYAANRYIIDRVKHEAPIWKKEYFEDGSCEWGHNCSCHDHGS